MFRASTDLVPVLAALFKVCWVFWCIGLVVYASAERAYLERLLKRVSSRHVRMIALIQILIRVQTRRIMRAVLVLIGGLIIWGGRGAVGLGRDSGRLLYAGGRA